MPAKIKIYVTNFMMQMEVASSVDFNIQWNPSRKTLEMLTKISLYRGGSLQRGLDGNDVTVSGNKNTDKAEAKNVNLKHRYAEYRVEMRTCEIQPQNEYFVTPFSSGKH